MKSSLSKSLLSVLVFLPLFSQALSDNPRCGLPDATSNEKFVEVTSIKTLDIGLMKNHELEALPVLTKQQLIIAAHDQDSEVKLVFNNQNLKKAVALLKDSSEGDDLYVAVYSYGRKSFTYVMYYPGGNEGGFIFTHGSTQLVALVGDQDINCQ